MEGNWILGMINVETNEVWMTIFPNNRKDSNTLYELITEHIELTSTIYTEAWRSYGLLAGGFGAQLSVNHCVNFVDPVTNCHTNNIESHYYYCSL